MTIGVLIGAILDRHYLDGRSRPRIGPYENRKYHIIQYPKITGDENGIGLRSHGTDTTIMTPIALSQPSLPCIYFSL